MPLTNKLPDRETDSPKSQMKVRKVLAHCSPEAKSETAGAPAQAL